MLQKQLISLTRKQSTCFLIHCDYGINFQSTSEPWRIEVGTVTLNGKVKGCQDNKGYNLHLNKILTIKGLEEVHRNTSLASVVWMVVPSVLCWSLYPTSRLIDDKMLPRIILALSHIGRKKIRNYMNASCGENNDKRNSVFTVEESFVIRKIAILAMLF